MSILYENQNYKFYLELVGVRNELLDKLKELVGDDDRELTPAEDMAFVKICDELDDVDFRMRSVFKELLEETDEMLLSD